MSYGTLPYRITDCWVYSLKGSDVAGTGVKLLVGRTLEAQPKEDTSQLTGYNGVAASNVSKTSADVTMEHGGLSLEILAAITGATIVTSGVSPNGKKKISVGKAGVARPYVLVVGQSLADDGGDALLALCKVKFQLPSGSSKDGEYLVTFLKGEAVRNASGDLIVNIQDEMAITLSSTAPTL